MSIPNRYMHSPNELVSLDDVDKTATLLAEVCREVSDEDGLHGALTHRARHFALDLERRE